MFQSETWMLDVGVDVFVLTKGDSEEPCRSFAAGWNTGDNSGGGSGLGLSGHDRSELFVTTKAVSAATLAKP